MVELLSGLWEAPNDLPTLARKSTDFFNRQTKQVDLVGGLAWAGINHQQMADDQIQQGTDANAESSLHEPATILHHLTLAGKLEMVPSLIEPEANSLSQSFSLSSRSLGLGQI